MGGCLFYLYSPELPDLKRAKFRKRSNVKLFFNMGCRSAGDPGLSIKSFNCVSSSRNMLSNSLNSSSVRNGTLSLENLYSNDWSCEVVRFAVRFKRLWRQWSSLSLCVLEKNRLVNVLNMN